MQYVCRLHAEYMKNMQIFFFLYVSGQEINVLPTHIFYHDLTKWMH